MNITYNYKEYGTLRNLDYYNKNSESIENVNNKRGFSLDNLDNTTSDFIIPQNSRITKLKENFDEKTLKRAGIIECSTCASRVYTDGSNDPGVSFKTPTHLSPEEAVSAVRSHEQEHVSNEKAKAIKEDRKIVSQNVQIFTSICPECGKSYVAGGVTKTTTKGISNPYNNKNESGNLLDIKL